VAAIDQEIETLRQYCPCCYTQLAIDTLVVHGCSRRRFRLQKRGLQVLHLRLHG
jgi:hypothetical protein